MRLILDIENARLHRDRNEEKPGQSEVLESTAKWTRDLALFWDHICWIISRGGKGEICTPRQLPHVTPVTVESKLFLAFHS